MRRLAALAPVCLALAAAPAAAADSSATLTLPGAHSLAEPHVAVDPTDPDHIVVGAQSQDEEVDSHPVLAFASFDGGRSFARTQLTRGGLSSTRECGYDPVVAFGTAGQVYFSRLYGHRSGGRGYETGALVQRSADGGRSFPASVAVASAVHRPFPRLPTCYLPDQVFPFDDKPWMAVDRSAGATRGRLYVLWSRFRSPSGASLHRTPRGATLYERHSDDGGRTFSARRALDRGGISGDAQVVVRPDGTAVALWVRRSRRRLYSLELRVALGAGGAFGPARTVARARDTAARFSYGSIPTMAADPAGRLAACWPEPAGRSRRTTRVSCIRSADGQAWSAPQVVAAPAPGQEQLLPALAAGGSGRFHLLFYEGAARRSRLRVRLLRSADAGASFAPLRVLETVRLGPDAFTLGDYVGLAGTPSGVVAAYTVARGRRGLRATRVRSLTLP